MATEKPKSSFFRRDDSKSTTVSENREASHSEKPQYENREARSGGYNNDQGRERKPWGDRNSQSGERREWKPRTEGGAERKPWGDRNSQSGERREWKPRTEGGAERKPWGDRNSQSGERREWTPRPEGERREWKPRTEGGAERKPWGDRNSQSGERREWTPRPDGERREWKPRTEGGAERKPWGDRNSQSGERREWTPRPDGEKRAWAPRPDGERREWKPRTEGGAERKPYTGEHKPWAPRAAEDQTREWKPRTPELGTRDAESVNGARTYLTRERRLNDRAADMPLTEKIEIDPKAPIRLNRYIAMSGICSRREADTLITDGQVTVNDVVISELGAKVTREDKICLNGQLLKGEKKVYIIMNKPKGYVTTTDDPHSDRTVIDLLKGEVKERVYPIGRLDKNTTGVLLLTNDGELTNELTHPSFEKRKLYHAFLDKAATAEDVKKLVTGFELEDGFIKADAAEFVEEMMDEVGIEIHSGRNRIVRRMFENLGYEVVKLDRVYFAGFTKMGLRRGFWRFLSPREVATLKGGSYN